MAKLNPGINDLNTLFPQLAEEWDYDKNAGLLPSDFCAGSHKRVWWICSKGHSYDMPLADRTSGKQGCPYCASKRVLPGFNDLKSLRPEVAELWDYKLNAPITPEMVLSSSMKKFWWICPECQMSYEMSINSRTKNSDYFVCPDCGRKHGAQSRIKSILKSGNTLLKLNPDLAAEWHPVKNGSLTPEDITSRSSKKIWWLCPVCGHEWIQSVHTRAKGEGCPNCALAYQTSEPEQVVFYYVSKYFPDAINSFKADFLGRSEIDIFIPSLMVGIEYDGVRWHNQAERDIEKSNLLAKHKIELIRIRETGLPIIEDGSYIIECKDYYKKATNLDKPVKDLLEQLSLKSGKDNEYDVDVSRDYQYIVEMFKTKKIERSFGTVRPDLIEEWHLSKNGLLTPFNVPASSHNKVWWKCNVCGCEWQAEPANRYSRSSGTGCPKCGRRKTLEMLKNRNLVAGETDLFTMRPDLVEEWDYEKNIGLPTQFTTSSNKIAWWKCKQGHEWQAKISSRTRKDGKGTNCPYCSNSKVLEGFNDLQTVNPALADEWNNLKNGDLLPTMLTAKSNRKVWWRCSKCGFEWQAAIDHRANGRGCPKCGRRSAADKLSRKNLIPGKTDLLSTQPDLVNEWNYEKNIAELFLSPSDVTDRSSKKVWWICPVCGKTYQAAIAARTGLEKQKGTGCPYCDKSHAKKVRNIETDDIFDSISQAGIAFGISASCIGDCCRRKAKTAGGYHWEFVKQE